jgi:ketosteroid isomerase-like protein
MTADPVEVVADTYAAWNGGDWGLERFDPRVEFELVGKSTLDQADTIRGRDALMAYWRRFWGAWKPGALWDIGEIGPVGDEQVLACGHLRVVGRSSGVESSTPIAHLWTVREGVIVRLLAGDNRDEVLAAAGP